MKKEVTYYLEDPARLQEISQTELDNWISEMPFHQPLQMLAGMKAEMDGHKADEGQKVYATYFAEDFELKKKKSKNGNNQRNKNTKQLVSTIDIESKKELEIDKTKLLEQEVNSPNIIVQEPKSDTREDLEDEELLEDFFTTPRIPEVKSELANELLEEEILSEVLEENISIVSPLITIDEESNLEVVDLGEQEENANAGLIAAAENPIVPSFEDTNKENLIDYSKYTKILDVENEANEKSSPKKKSSSKKSKSLDIIDKDTLGKKKKKKSKKEEKTKKKKGKDRDKDLEQKDKPKKKKKKSKKSKNIEDKGLIGKVHKRKKKAEVKKKKKKVKYIVLDSAKKDNFKLDDYEGISSYTSWLLEQESINKNSERAKNSGIEVKNSKNNSKKKKKKKKSLKIALDSIKKQDSIISEPLADILAQQGHKKKARKMFLKLAYLFPEKKEHFEAKIDALQI